MSGYRILPKIAVVAVAAASLSFGPTTLWSETIQLRNKRTVDGQVLRIDDEQVIIGLPRESIETIDGKSLPPVLREGATAPAFTVKDLTGRTQSVGGKTGQVTLLHFWVHWCPHCRSDAPKIQALYNQFRDNPKVQVLTVSLDEKRTDTERFINDHQVTYPVILASEQTEQGMNLPELYQVNGFPLTYLIDAQGTIRHKTSGSFVESHQDLSTLLAQLL